MTENTPQNGVCCIVAPPSNATAQQTPPDRATGHATNAQRISLKALAARHLSRNGPCNSRATEGEKSVQQTGEKSCHKRAKNHAILLHVLQALSMPTRTRHLGCWRPLQAASTVRFTGRLNRKWRWRLTSCAGTRTTLKPACLGISRGCCTRNGKRNAQATRQSANCRPNWFMWPWPSVRHTATERLTKPRCWMTFAITHPRSYRSSWSISGAGWSRFAAWIAAVPLSMPVSLSVGPGFKPVYPPEGIGIPIRMSVLGTSKAGILRMQRNNSRKTDE